MTKHPSADPAAFREDFQRMFAIATSDTATSWFNDRAWAGPRAPYEIWQEQTTSGAPAGVGVKSYDAWRLMEPESHRIEIQRPTQSGKPRMPGGQAYVVAPLQAVSSFGRNAPDGSSLAMVTDTLVRHLNEVNQSGSEPNTTALHRCIGHLVGKGLLLGPSVYADADNQPGLLARTLDGLEPGRIRDLVGRYASSHLNTILLQKMQDARMGSVRQAIQSVAPSFTVRAAADLESVGLLTPDFWWKTGVEGKLVFKGLAGLMALRRLESDLTARPEAVLAEVPAGKLHIFMRRYIGQLLNSYVDESQQAVRDQAKLQSIIEGMATDRSAKMGAGLRDLVPDLRLLVHLANGVAIGTNMNMRDQGIDSPRLQLPELDVDKLWNVPPALLRILYATVRPDADPEDMADMFEQDSLHVSVLEVIRHQLRHQLVEPNEGDTRLRYPDVSASELPELMGELRKPDARRHLHAWRRRKHRSPGVARGYGLFLPGGAAS